MSSTLVNRRWGGSFLVAMLATGLAACGGDDGERGPAGEAGPPPVIGTRSVPPEALNPKITNVDVSSPMVVDFQVTDERGFAVVGVDSGVQFTVNKLVPGSNGENDVWSTYVRNDDEGVTDAQAGTYSSGTLEDHGDGRYTFTFADDLEDISGITFEPSLTHRVGIELRDVVILGEEIPAGSNAVYDFVPSGGNVTQREIVKTESCATCHGPDPFSFHGGPRKDTEYCVTCHQKGSVDAGTGNTMDFRVMIHKIHRGADLNNLPYQFCGFTCERLGFPPDDFSDIHFPQDVRNCTTCHDDTDSDTPQATQVFNRPTAAVCASCHDDLAFNSTGLTNANGNHDPGAASNSECATCHADGGLAPDKVVRVAHQIPEKVWAARIEYNIIDISNVGEGLNPVIQFSITDPTNGDAPYDITSSPELTGAETSVNMDIAWPTSDYTNVSNDTGTAVTGSAPSRPVSIPLADDSGTLLTGISANPDGSYTIDTGLLGSPPTIPSTTPALGSGAVVIEGHTSGDFDGDGTYDDQVPVTSVVDYFPITDPVDDVTARREVVDPAKCQNCHGQNDGLAFHGNNRTDNTQVCVVCHNPNQTDLAMRPADPDGSVNHENLGTVTSFFTGATVDPPDDLESRPIDFKYMIHAIHGSEVRENDYFVMGFGNSGHNFGDVHFPRSPSDCLACHVDEDSYALPLATTVLGTTNETQATVNTSSPFGTSDFVGGAAAGDPTDDNKWSPEAAVCSACHDSTTATNHMAGRGSGGESFGNAFLLNPDPVGTADTQADMDLPFDENCAFCHGPGGFLDVAEVHAEAGGE